MTNLPDTWCHVERWTLADSTSQILGYTRWAQFEAYMRSNRAAEVGPGLWECVEPDGTRTRYSAVVVEVAW